MTSPTEEGPQQSSSVWSRLGKRRARVEPHSTSSASSTPAQPASEPALTQGGHPGRIVATYIQPKHPAIPIRGQDARTAPEVREAFTLAFQANLKRAGDHPSDSGKSIVSFKALGLAFQASRKKAGDHPSANKEPAVSFKVLLPIAGTENSEQVGTDNVKEGRPGAGGQEASCKRTVPPTCS